MRLLFHSEFNFLIESETARAVGALLDPGSALILFHQKYSLALFMVACDLSSVIGNRCGRAGESSFSSAGTHGEMTPLTPQPH